jgi:hypothetical protein
VLVVEELVFSSGEGDRHRVRGPIAVWPHEC